MTQSNQSKKVNQKSVVAAATKVIGKTAEARQPKIIKTRKQLAAWLRED